MARGVDEEIVCLRQVGDIVRDVKQREQRDGCYHHGLDDPVGHVSPLGLVCGTFPGAVAEA